MCADLPRGGKVFLKQTAYVEIEVPVPPGTVITTMPGRVSIRANGASLEYGLESLSMFAQNLLSSLRVARTEAACRQPK